MTLFPVEQAGKLPVTIYSGLAPSNPHARVTWFQALDLANRGLLAHTLIDQGLMEFDPEDKWFQAVKTLEEKGIRRGVTPREVAAVLNCAPKTAKRHMLVAENHLYAVFGLNVMFNGRGRWQIATASEAATKYARMTAEMEAKWRRMSMYRPHFATLHERHTSVQLPLLVAVRSPRKRGGSGAAAD